MPEVNRICNMSLSNNIFQKSYYKVRIIFTFCFVTIALVLVMSGISYHFIRDLYLEQLSEQVNSSSDLLSRQTDRKYLNLLHLGMPLPATSDYFRNLFGSCLDPELQSEAFIFDGNYMIMVHSAGNSMQGKEDTRLLLNRKEISELKIGQVTASMPFKGDDGKWYMWSFNRLDDSFWLAIRESAHKLQKVEEFSLYFWYIGIGGIIASVILGWIIARTISRPVDSLVKFSSQIGEGNLLSSAPDNMHGEMKILSSAMDKMRQDLSKTQNEKESMLAQIAHEIRNPLGGIELLANLVKEDHQRENKETVYLNKILGEVNGLKSLITAFLNYSRPAAPSPAWISISSIFEEIEHIFHTRLEEKKCRLIFKDEQGEIFFDPVHLRNVLINLTANALESITADGTICISAVKENNRWKISVTDDGCGISPENLRSVFEPFFSTKREGTGLGLAISRKLCYENNADLTAANNPDKGSVFTITKNEVNDYSAKGRRNTHQQKTMEPAGN